MVFQIAWRGDSGEAYIRAEPDGDHVAWHVIKQPDACVKTIADNVLQLAVDHEFDMDVRILDDEVGNDMTNQRPDR
ncbi:hypothetical protein D3C87_1652220 [compost metagenome]